MLYIIIIVGHTPPICMYNNYWQSFKPIVFAKKETAAQRPTQRFPVTIFFFLFLPSAVPSSHYCFNHILFLRRSDTARPALCHLQYLHSDHYNMTKYYISTAKQNNYNLWNYENIKRTECFIFFYGDRHDGDR